ncbi:nuclear transport factor 2 family protein [Kribbella sp. NPDC002412]
MSRTTDHVDAFNHAVTTGDWDTFAARFAADATMTFVNVPAGPFHGRTAIAAAYRENPPTETMTLFDDETRFRWSSGTTGTMALTWTPAGAVQTLTVTFD